MPALTCHDLDDQLDGYAIAACEHERRVAAAIARVERDEALKQHLDALGMPDAEAYRQWCRRHGLSTRLAKSSIARADEIDLMRVVDSWRFSKDDCDRLIRLRRFARRGAWDKPRRAVESLVARYLDDVVEADEDARIRYARLVSAFAVGCENFRCSRHVPEWLVEAIAHMAREADEFIRDPEDWQPRGVAYRNVLQSFVRHVLVKYELPPRWLENVWFDTERMGTMWIGAYIRLGQGYGLHHENLVFDMTKRAAREALKAPRSFWCRQALRFGQAVACGADRARAKAIAESGVQWIDDPFGLTVVQWLAQHADFPIAKMLDLVDYINELRDEQRWVCDTRGRWVQRPADPDWKIAGRTTRSLLRDMDEASQYDAEQEAKTFSQSLPTVRPERIRMEGSRDKWLMVPVAGSVQFEEEGDAMSHCVASYQERAEEGELRIYSLRHVDGRKLNRRVTICVRPSVGISEARGYANRRPSQKELSVIAHWARKRRISMKLLEV